MGQKIAETHLIKVESGSNANKFYRCELQDDDTVIKNWGRVGATGQTKVEKGGKYAYDSVIRQKMSRGYSKVDVVGASTSTQQVSNNALKEAANASLASGSTDPVLTSLIERLVTANNHTLLEASGGMITVDLAGQVSTPLGVISAASLREARDLLDRMNVLSSGADLGGLTERYLRLVPQNIPVSAGRGWADSWLTTMTTADKQYALLDALDSSVRFADTATRDAQTSQGAETPRDLFRYRVTALDPKSEEFKAVVTRYDETKQAVHAWSSKRPVRVFALEDIRHGSEIRSTAERVRNVRRLWHGTGAANVLSILAKGLFVPPSNSRDIHIAGRMFGDGVYLSRSASKSLGYSVGHWGGGRSESNFMFLTETAMGSEYRPTGSAWDRGVGTRARTEKNKFGNSYDSINVEAGKAGVRNHEAIVWDAMQVSLRWLVEFEG
jgi:poly [ADP-ribose] polymerase